ncbi:unnamed protein product, partial [Heterotrigona itama]
MSCVGMPCCDDGFRLAGPASECSLRSKARIDALFEDSRSIYGSNFGGWYGGVSTMNSNHLEEMGADEQRRVNSAVQARIEAMFASVEAESGTPGECAAAILPVKYMGAAPVGGRVASVRGLQEPLRQLLERIEGSVRAELEVSRRGLTFRTPDTTEKNNPFRRIAVWSALRLRSKATPSGELHHAFLPLVGDHEQSQAGEEKHADLYRTMRDLKTTADHYPPIFAVVMRRPGAARLLECHAFGCETEEDAVAAAATLYRALVADLDANRRRPRHANGVGCMSLTSIASSYVREPSPSSRFGIRMNVLQSEAVRSIPQHPVRPPRTKKTSMSSSVTEDEAAKSPELQKAPRRKKKNSDVKAEDILEARGRRREAVPKEKTNPATQNVTSVQKNFDSRVSKKEERENIRNKTLFGSKKELDAPEKIEIGNSSTSVNKIYDVGASGLYETVSNKYEKLPIIGRAGKDAEKQTPNKESEDEREKIYDKSYGSYNLNNPVQPSRDTPKNQEIRSTRSDAVTYDRIEKPACKSEENSLYERAFKRNSKERLYEDHFKDVDKIYSVAQEEIYNDRGGKLAAGKIKSSQEDIFFGRSCNNEIYQLNRENRGDSVPMERRRPRDPEKITTGKRVSRVVTMDKPLKKQLSDSTSNLNLTEFNQPRVRKRSRAGSEPPVSRSEDATKALQETRLKRSQSDVDVDRGDLMTRVELPRRGSFLKPGSARRPNSVKGGTPLGFTELFDEFRNQEGLTSVDDILAAIIDPEGMSFNDLKPLYKEFLLKLAATLTQDELYQRSASIMRRRRRPQRRRSSRRTCLLGRAIKRSVSRLKGGPTEFTSVIFPARRLNDSFGSSSSCDARNNHRNRMLANKMGKRRSSWRANKSGSHYDHSGRRLNRSAGAAANRSSSGYVSCSECSYDSESCTCVSADKCYCSLSRRIPTELHVPPNTVVCACDTDSCSESNKCYCARQPNRPTILEQLRQRGIVPSESTLSRAGSPDRARVTKTGRCRTPFQGLDVPKKSSSSYSSSNNLALDYDLFNPGRKSQQSSDSEKVLVVSARDTQGRLVYVGGADRDKKCLSHCSNRSGAHHEALSIKKSAEIAAIFGADWNRISRRASNASSIKSSISLEAGLGYLP